jgi:hypothetical protein
MKIIELLTEGKDAPLYHATHWYNLPSIIEQNTLLAKTTHRLDKRIDFIHNIPHNKREQSELYQGEDIVRGVSLTRSFSFAKQWSSSGCSVVLILDQSKLIQKYKIIPHNFWSKHHVHSIQNSNVKQSQKRNTHISEAEEFLIGNINNLDKYLLGIWTNNTDLLFELLKDENVDDFILNRIVDFIERFKK